MDLLDDLNIRNPHKLLKTARNYKKLYFDQLTSNNILYKKYKLLKNNENECYETLLERVHNLEINNQNLKYKCDSLENENKKLKRDVYLYENNMIHYAIIYPTK